MSHSWNAPELNCREGPLFPALKKCKRPQPRSPATGPTTSSPSVASIDVAQYFFDTSALVKRYHNEDGTEQVRAIFISAENLVRISTLGAVEIHSAFAIKVRSGQLTRAAAQILTEGALADLASGRIKPYSVTSRHFADAEHMVRQFAFDYRLRSLDAIQLSVALDLRSQGLADSIVTADRAVQDVASLVGLAVLNPQDR